MAYTATSTYEYITGDELEAFTNIVYATVDATAFAEANVMANVTAAEEIINGLLGVSVAQTVTSGIKAATKFLAGWLMNSNMNNLGYTGENSNAIFELTWTQIITLTKEILAGDSNIGVDTIPMSGANRYYSHSYRGY